MASVQKVAAGPGLFTWGDIAADRDTCARALPGHTEKLYELGYEFTVPLHRLMSKDDPHGALLGEKRVGPRGITYRCALREIEGAYADGAKPSQIGLPAFKGAAPKPKKRKADELMTLSAAADASATYARPAVPASECLAMLNRLHAFASAKGVATSDVWMHSEAINWDSAEP